MNKLASFVPHPLVRGCHVQTMCAARCPVRNLSLRETIQEMMFSVQADGESVCLRGFYSPQPPSVEKGLVFFIHGWLGCADSIYILSISDYVFRQGYSVFRINLRDHGYTEALNERSFHGARLEEVYQAAKVAAALKPNQPFYVVGCSMGGNFALRVALRQSQMPEIPNFQQTIAINPIIHPGATLKALDQGALVYSQYFLRRWKATLRRKQAAFPQIYDLTEALAMKTTNDISEFLVPRYTEFPDSTSYYQVYAAPPEKLEKIAFPTTILTSADDPLIPISDFEGFETLNPHIQLIKQQYGGHIGYFDIFPFRRWLPEAVGQLIGSRSI